MGKCNSKVETKHTLVAEEIAFLKQHTEFDEDDIKVWYNQFKLDNPDLKFTKERFIAVYTEFFDETTASHHYTERIFHMFDTDKDGSLEFEEFLQCINYLSIGNREQKLDWAFRNSGPIFKYGFEAVQYFCADF